LLVLTRQPQNAFFISHPEGRITVRILNVSGPSVRLAIDAPRSVEILRDDAHEKTDSPTARKQWEVGFNNSPTPETKESTHDR